MTDFDKIKKTLISKRWFHTNGVYALVDGQYGSTGKGLVGGLLGEMFFRHVSYVTNNAGPNSGHTFYYKGDKHVLKQLPSFGITAILKCREVKAYEDPTIIINSGAILDLDVLGNEISYYDVSANTIVYRGAAVISEKDKTRDSLNVASIASTGQGTGEALINKLSRNLGAVHAYYSAEILGDSRPGYKPYVMPDSVAKMDWQKHQIFMEVSQGFSLGINSGFYPYTTSRECTVSQGLSDAGLPPQSLQKTMMVVRTYPIRVGNTETGWSGPCYPDQKELDWEKDFPDVQPETTTVTGRVRRIFTWSNMQFIDALRSNHPDVIFVNFVNYLTPGTVDAWVETNILIPYEVCLGKKPDAILLGYGPYPDQVKLWESPSEVYRQNVRNFPA